MYDDVITASSLKHIGNKLSSDRRSGFIFLVLSCVGETRYYSSNATSGGSATSINHNEKFHEVIIDAICSGLHDEYIFIPDGLAWLLSYGYRGETTDSDSSFTI
jgi:hypothetical protein